MFYPPEGLCRAEPEGGPIVFTFHFIGIDNGTGIFNLETVFAKKIPENVLSPVGTLQSRARRWSNCFYLCFIVGVGDDTGGFTFCGGERPF